MPEMYQSHAYTLPGPLLCSQIKQALQQQVDTTRQSQLAVMSATAEAAGKTARKTPEKGKAGRAVPGDGEEGPQPRLVPIVVPVDSEVLDMIVTPAYIEPDAARPPCAQPA